MVILRTLMQHHHHHHHHPAPAGCLPPPQDSQSTTLGPASCTTPLGIACFFLASSGLPPAFISPRFDRYGGVARWLGRPAHHPNARGLSRTRTRGLNDRHCSQGHLLVLLVYTVWSGSVHRVGPLEFQPGSPVSPSCSPFREAQKRQLLANNISLAMPL